MNHPISYLFVQVTVLWKKAVFIIDLKYEMPVYTKYPIQNTLNC